MKIVEIIKASVGPLLVGLLAWLAYHVIHGDVTQQNSYGLDAIFTIIGGMGTAYALWAYRSSESIGKGNGNGNKPS